MSAETGNCPVCGANSENFIDLNKDTAMDAGMKIALNRRGMLLAQHVSPKGTRIHSDIVKVPFCPLCGRGFDQK